MDALPVRGLGGARVQGRGRPATCTFDGALADDTNVRPVGLYGRDEVRPRSGHEPASHHRGSGSLAPVRGSPSSGNRYFERPSSQVSGRVHALKVTVCMFIMFGLVSHLSRAQGKQLSRRRVAFGVWEMALWHQFMSPERNSPARV